MAKLRVGGPRRFWKLLLATTGLSVLSSVFQPAHAASGDIGYLDQPTNGASAPGPSGQKPESKLWWNDGRWWGCMFDTGSQTFHIFRLSTVSQMWIDTGVMVDDRSGSRADTLWDGTHLYIASHIYTESPSSGSPARLYRFGYDSSLDRYSLDPGFPVAINNYATETLVIDKDSTGKLWATWIQDRKVYVNRTAAGDSSWGTPFVLPVSGTSVDIDDISSVVAFGGDRIGVMWSNQTTGAMDFTAHHDGQPDTTWDATETAIAGPSNADDHINLKSCGAEGRVYAAVKTSQTASAAALVNLMVRAPATGAWSTYLFARVADAMTRPIVVVDQAHGVLHMFAASPEAGGTIYEKTSPVAAIAFPPGTGTPVIRDAASPDMDDATSTKQCLDGTSGLAVLASNETTRRYWHAYEEPDAGCTDPCDDGNACTTNDACSGNICVGGSPPSCDDGNPCTDDSCNPASGCVHVSNTAPCSDGNACTTVDACQAGACIGSSPVVCPAGDLCHDAGACDPGTGLCSSPPKSDGTTCNTPRTVTLAAAMDCWIQQDKTTQNKGSDATLAVKSDSGKEERALVEFNLSSIPSCATVTSATLRLDLTSNNQSSAVRQETVHRLASPWTESGATWARRDGTNGWLTAGGDFGGATATASVTGNAHWVEWNTTPDVAAFVSGAAPNDGWLVKDAHPGASPNTTIGYASRENASSGNRPQLVVTYNDCGDGNACTRTDTCQSGVCTGSDPVVCAAPAACHLAVCAPATGLCSYPPAPDGASCSDGNGCTGGDACAGGACGGGPPTNCDDGNVCTDDSCSPASGCIHVNNSVPCDDGNPCTAGETCTLGICLGGQPVDADGDSHRPASCGGDDCDDANGQVWGIPSEVLDLRVSRAGGPGGPTTLSWTAPASGGTPSSMVYDTLRSGSASNFGTAAVCLENADGPNTVASDSAVPPPGGVFFYLVRAANACPQGAGPLGTDSSGAPHTGRSCR